MSDNTPQQPAPEPSPYGAVPPVPPAPPAPSFEAPTASPYGAPPAAPSAEPAAYGAPPVAPPYAGGTTPGYQPAAYPAPAYGYGGYQQQKTNVLAIVSMIASIVGFVLSWTWILGLGLIAGPIMGHIALSQIKHSGEKGRGMALAGVIVGYVGIGLGVLGVIAFFMFFGAIAGYSSVGTYGS